MATSKSNATSTLRQSLPALPKPTGDKKSLPAAGQTLVFSFTDDEKTNLRYWRLRSDVNKLEKELVDERDKRNQFEAWAKGLLVGDEKQLPMPIHLRRFEAKAKPERHGPLSVLLEMWQNPKSAFAICVLAIAMRALGSVALLSVMTLMAYVGLVALSGTISCWMYKALGNILFKTEWEHPFRKYLEVESLIPCGRVQAATAGAVNWLNQNVVKLCKLLLVQDIMESAKFGLRLYILSIVIETGGPSVVALTTFDTILLSIFLIFATRLLLEVKRITLLKKILTTELSRKND